MSCKYSIIIPARNGGKYLKACIETIVSQDYSDYELIISDDHSTDGTKEYLEQYLLHPNVTILEPDEELSMTEHWEWALSHASGTWQIFVGQDDGLQPYFFKLADKITKIAEEKNVRTIMSSRAYYFWQGCEPVYGDISVNFLAQDKVKIHNSMYESAKALLGIQTYFELPEMYTTALFHKSILEEARKKQNGKVLTCHPQDANLGVIAMSLEKKYLKSYIPLGWVGSSPKSAGMAIGSQNKGFQNEDAEVLKKLEQEYTQKIQKSKFKYNKLAGDFSFGDIALYFWQAYLETSSLRTDKINSFLISKPFKFIFFSSLQSRLWMKKDGLSKKEQFEEIVKINKCFLPAIKVGAIFIFFIVLLYKIVNIPIRIFRKLNRMFSNSIVKVFFNRSSHQELTMREASDVVLKNMDKIFDNWKLV
jgi:glycosyltransferase involved in cell wall biosynthesis